MQEVVLILGLVCCIGLSEAAGLWRLQQLFSELRHPESRLVRADDDVYKEIKEANIAVQKAFNEKNVGDVRTYYPADAVLYAEGKCNNIYSNLRPDETRGNIDEYVMNPPETQGAELLFLNDTQTVYVLAEDLVLSVSYWDYIEPEGSNLPDQSLRDSIIWRKIDGKWKTIREFFSDCDNSDNNVENINKNNGNNNS